MLFFSDYFVIGGFPVAIVLYGLIKKRHFAWEWTTICFITLSILVVMVNNFLFPIMLETSSTNTAGVARTLITIVAGTSIFAWYRKFDNVIHTSGKKWKRVRGLGAAVVLMNFAYGWVTRVWPAYMAIDSNYNPALYETQINNLSSFEIFSQTGLMVLGLSMFAIGQINMTQYFVRRRSELTDDVSEFRYELEAGVIGFRWDGYLGIVENDITSAVISRVESRNLEWSESYRTIAEKNRIPKETIEERIGKKRIQRAGPGIYILNNNGKWKKKV